MQPLTPVTRNFMIACTVVFCLQQIPMLRLEYLFALWPVRSGVFAPWQVLTYTVLHANAEHLILNLLGFWMFGPVVESRLGARKYIQLMVASGVAGGLLHILMSLVFPAFGPVIGASGILYGLLMACAVYSPGMRLGLFMIIPTDMKTAVWVFAGIELLMGVTGYGGTAHFAHLGGFGGAYLMILYWRHWRGGGRGGRGRRPPKLRDVSQR